MSRGSSPSPYPDESLTRHCFSTVKPRPPGNLTVHPNVSHTWLLMWTNPYPTENHLYSELTYMVNISNENDPMDVSVCTGGFLHTLWESGRGRLGPWGPTVNLGT